VTWPKLVRKERRWPGTQPVVPSSFGKLRLMVSFRITVFVTPVSESPGAAYRPQPHNHSHLLDNPPNRTSRTLLRLPHTTTPEEINPPHPHFLSSSAPGPSPCPCPCSIPTLTTLRTSSSIFVWHLTHRNSLQISDCCFRSDKSAKKSRSGRERPLRPSGRPLLTSSSPHAGQRSVGHNPASPSQGYRSPRE
jgi:hypothetical protein